MDINRNKEIQDGFVEANTRVIVMRTPIVTGDPIELTYNPKQTGGTFDKHGGKVRLEKHMNGGAGLGAVGSGAPGEQDGSDNLNEDGTVDNEDDENHRKDAENVDANEEAKNDAPNVIKFYT